MTQGPAVAASGLADSQHVVERLHRELKTLLTERATILKRIGVISDGKMKMIGTMAELRTATGKQGLREIFLDLLGLPA